MLFNSYIFIFLFLPVTLSGFYLISGRGHHRIAKIWLVAASLFFYGWGNPSYLGLIIGSILFNYAMGVALMNSNQFYRRWMLTFGIMVNLALIGYYKYANFFINNLNSTFGSGYHLETIILPLAISFFTFQQIAYLTDAYQGKTREYNFLNYSLFVTFFPQLIAGPIVHHKEMISQFTKNIVHKINYEHFAVGSTIFTLGLFKKVVLADSIAIYATHVFDAAENGITLSFFEAWGGTLAYTFQLYFDFSGYSDMAIGLARLFGIKLPLNFNSPYKAANIINFWRCWHITLSRFFREHIYIPLGGNHKGNFRQFLNLMITMLLCGLWHGASWTFVAWGALHGIYLLINHSWNLLRHAFGHDISKSTLLGRWSARLITFLFVAIAWVFFRAKSFSGITSVLSSMAGLNGISLPQSFQAMFVKYDTLLIQHIFIFKGLFFNHLIPWSGGIKLILLSLFISWFAPNTQQFMYQYQPVIENIDTGQLPNYFFLKHSFTYAWCFLISFLFVFSVIYISRGGEFLYFRF